MTRPSPPFLLIDDARRPEAPCRLFTAPHEVVACDTPADLDAALARIEALQAAGAHLAGYLAYELGYLLEPKLAPFLPQERDGPLLWMAAFDPPEVLDSAEVTRRLDAWTRGGFDIDAVVPKVARRDYLASIQGIRGRIQAGEVYQINHTFPCDFRLAGDPVALYAHLRRRQRAGHGRLVVLPDRCILSLSPERFLAVENGLAQVRPMKGTAPRAAAPGDDRALTDWLRSDEKSRAENLMIVDLLRNDLGRVAELGSVAVSDLYTVETYPTLHQMTSGVTARLRPGTGFSGLLRALFPCGSVTGAPKVRAMQVIRQEESRARGVYTGAVGWLAPSGDLDFNVAIRTLTVDSDGNGVLGIGSGIVHDSDPAAEYEECLLKARFLTDDTPSFSLIETLLRPAEGGLWLLEEHLERLADSAARFGFVCRPDQVRQTLESAAAALPGGRHRLRLLLDVDGGAEVSASPLSETGPPLTFALADTPVDRDSPFTYHKTTRRGLYDAARAASETDEVVFLNDRGEVAEGTITNVFVERDGRLLTPPVACGLLPGTLRRHLLDTGRAVEALLYPADLGGSKVFLGNSVRGLRPARLLV